jgi:hypothetical protein
VRVGVGAAQMTHNKQLQRTVQRHRGRAASASFHFALASLGSGQRAAAELRRYAATLWPCSPLWSEQTTRSRRWTNRRPFSS